MTKGWKAKSASPQGLELGTLSLVSLALYQLSYPDRLEYELRPSNASW